MGGNRKSSSNKRISTSPKEQRQKSKGRNNKTETPKSRQKMSKENNKETENDNKNLASSANYNHNETSTRKEFRGGELNLDTVTEESSCSEDYCVSPRSNISKDENTDYSEPISPVSQDSFSRSPTPSPLNLSVVENTARVIVGDLTSNQKEKSFMQEQTKVLSESPDMTCKSGSRPEPVKENEDGVSSDKATVSHIYTNENILPEIPEESNNNNDINTSQNKSTTSDKQIPNNNTIMNYSILVKNVSNDFLNPITFDKIICNRLANIKLDIHQTIRQNGYRLQFKDKENQARFLGAFKEREFGARAEFLITEEQRKIPQKPTSTTTFTCVIRDISTDIVTKELLDTIKEKYPQVTNITRIINDRGPLPLVRVFTKDPNLASGLITNGIYIGNCRYRVEESRNSGRPFPCRICYLYHINKTCTKRPFCYKCGKDHPSYLCNQTPNKNFCATCRKVGHRTAAASCPLRPTQSFTSIPDRIYRSSNSIGNHKNYAETLKDTNDTNTNSNQKVPTVTINKETYNTQIIEEIVNKAINDQIEKVSKWMLSVLALTLSLPEEARTISKINSIIKAPTEEFLHRHLNMIRSIDGHIFIGNEEFEKKRKTNGKENFSEHNCNDDGE